MKKTVAQFKRDIYTGLHIECVSIEAIPYNNVTLRYDGEWRAYPIAEKMQGPRYVSYKDTTGFYLKKPNDPSTRGSFCGYPKADNLEYINDTFVITERDRYGTAYERRTYKMIKFK